MPRIRRGESLQWLGLRRLTAQQSNDLYELIVERHRRASFCITSNRSVDEWLGLFDDDDDGPALAVSPDTLIPKSRATSGLMVVVTAWPNGHGE